MKILNTFPMLRLVIPFGAGVISWAFLLEEIDVDIRWAIACWVLVALLCIPLAMQIRLKRKIYLFGVFLNLMAYALGALLTVSVSDHLYPNYLESVGTERAYWAEIVEQPVTKTNSLEVVATLVDIDNEQQGKVLLYVALDSVSAPLKYGQRILLRTKLSPVVGMGNPHEFNYARYLRFHNILYRGYVRSGELKYVDAGKPGIRGAFLSLRTYLIQKFKEAGLEGNELAVASALVLGYRVDIDADLLNAYAGAGATHVLAVSGLHVGIVYVILNAMLGFLDKRRSGRILKMILLVTLLFGYAILTGLSASVLRAATMFSFVAIGRSLNRQTNIFNTLASSAFILIVLDPLIVMQVGFQLSYLAVIGIVLIQPLLFNLWASKYRLIDWAWGITCVSIAAQIATFPLGLLYFHQFPNLFLLSNLLVIPAAILILHIGLFLFVASIWQPIMLVTGFLLRNVISFLNQMVEAIEQIPNSVLRGIDISLFESILIYIGIVGILVFILKRQKMGLYVSLALAIVLVSMQIIEVYQQKNQRLMAVYNVKQETAMALIQGTTLHFIGSPTFWSNERAKLFHVQHHWWNLGITEENFIELDDSVFNRELQWRGKHFSILSLKDSLKRELRLDVSEELDFVIIDAIDWNYCPQLSQLNTDSIILPNKFGPKMMEWIKESAGNKTVIALSETGMISL